jgi:hypothetical protein
MGRPRLPTLADTMQLGHELAVYCCDCRYGAIGRAAAAGAPSGRPIRMRPSRPGGTRGTAERWRNQTKTEREHLNATAAAIDEKQCIDDYKEQGFGELDQPSGSEGHTAQGRHGL